MTTMDPHYPEGDVLAHYSRALDEIFALRAALIYEARVIEAHLALATFPKSRRVIAEQQIQRMHTAVRDGAYFPYSSIDSYKIQWLLEQAGAKPTLTRGQWEQQQG